MAAFQTFVILPLVACILVHGATVYQNSTTGSQGDSDASVECGTLKCPAQAVGCILTTQTDSSGNTVVSESCINSAGKAIDKANQTYSQGQFPPAGSNYINGTWGSGTFNYTAVEQHLHKLEKEAQQKVQDALNQLKKDLDKLHHLFD
ncbi:unnamed protein product [Hermetia illucens]|uniref:Secreted protein n=1 Tax=Hermetia illucens TaxID=343691 RepID=A0A7R8UGH7_HERIL|nr:uncharacterized protein LOC119648677 [Hermetia illucens]CAD7080450.1 unnamed protein product [Hermetia illucens]